MPNDNPSLNPNPSTYKQVLENMASIISQMAQITQLDTKVTNMGTTVSEMEEVVEGVDTRLTAAESTIQTQGIYIEDLKDSIGPLEDLPMDIKTIADKVEELNEKILEPTSSGGDVITTDEGIKVTGVHTNLSGKDNNLKPVDYEKGLTVELKKVSAVGLNGKEGMTLPYCFVLTLNQDSTLPDIEEAVESGDFAPMQLAFAPGEPVQYIRTTQNANTWNSWEQTGGTAPEVKKQFIESVTQPTGQDVGDYWCQPLADEE